MAQYVIGVDFGSLSGRAVLVDSRTGQIAAQRTVPYAHGVMTEGGAGWALHHPADYLDVLETAVPQVLRDASVTAEQVTAMPPERRAGQSPPLVRRRCFPLPWTGR